MKEHGKREKEDRRYKNGAYDEQKYRKEKLRAFERGRKRKTGKRLKEKYKKIPIKARITGKNV